MSHVEEYIKKPVETRDRIVQLIVDLLRIEQFARYKAPGWNAWRECCDTTQRWDKK